MKELIGKKVLVTTQGWFIAPNGVQYKGAFGVLKAIHTSESTLGFTPSRTHTNWYLQVGNITIAGCQVLYCVESNECNLGMVEDFSIERTHGDLIIGRNAEKFNRGSYIYNADL